MSRPAEDATRYSSACAIIADLPRLTAFYSQVLCADPLGDDELLCVETPASALALTTRTGRERMAPGSTRGAGYGGHALEFEALDVDAEYERRCALGMPIVNPPTALPWGVRSVWAR